MDAKYLLSCENVKEITLFLCSSNDTIKFPFSKLKSKIFLFAKSSHKLKYLSKDPEAKSLPS